MHFLGSIVCAMVLVVFIQPAFSDSPLDFIGQAFKGSADMLKAYKDMRQANWEGADIYFNAKGNFDAANRGPGGKWAAQVISDAREKIKGITGRGAEDSREQVANQWGRDGGNPNFFRPPGLPSEY